MPTVRFLDRTTPPHIFTLIVLAGISTLALNIFLPSLPGMTAYFETDYGVMQLAVAGYLGINAILQLLIGPISDRVGRRPVIIAGLVIFLLATLGCLMSTNIWVFLVFRMFQGGIVAAMVLSRAVVRDMVPAREAASMIGYVTMGMSVVPMIGPAVGGMLDAGFGWQGSFWALFAAGAAVLWLVWRDLGETAPLEGRTFGDQFAEYPELFTSYRFWGYALAAALSSGAFFAYLGGAPFVGAQVFGLSPSELGFFFGAPAVGYFTGNFLSGRFSTRIGINRMVFYGSVANAIGHAINLATLYAGLSTPVTFFGLMTLMGLGNGMTIPNATAGALSVRPSLAGTASGLAGFLMIGGGAGLSALAGALLGPGTGAFPLVWLMLLTALGGILAISLVILRERQLAARPPESMS